MLTLYQTITAISAPALTLLLKYRLYRGKEEQSRLPERKGISSIIRPDGQLIWIHAASVGEAQSAMILIERINILYPNITFLVTSGTLTSANLMATRLPNNATHQFYPLDHPKWIESFLNHWKPDLALWMESELWPNMLLNIASKKIPAVLVNARLSDKSFNRWKLFKKPIQEILSAFSLILTQTKKDEDRYKTLGAQQVITTNNLKYSAIPLPHRPADLADLEEAIQNRKTWIYASTHKGEEIMACRLHKRLKEKYHNLLTIVVPRHPERRDDIEKEAKITGLHITMRTENKILPTPATDIYIADTLGELGLFYRLSCIAMIGRSFSHDGGGGHNPIEAAQLKCAVLTGPNIQYQTELFDSMFKANAASQVTKESELLEKLDFLLGDDEERQKMIDAATKFANEKDHIIENVLKNLDPFLDNKKNEAA